MATGRQTDGIPNKPRQHAICPFCEWEGASPYLPDHIVEEHSSKTDTEQTTLPGGGRE